MSSATAHPPFWTPAEEAAPGGSLSPAQPGPWQGWRFYICCFASGGGFPEERGGDGCFIRSALVEGILMTQFILWQGSEVWTCPKIKRKLGCVGIEVQSNTYTSLLLGQPVAQTGHQTPLCCMFGTNFSLRRFWHLPLEHPDLAMAAQTSGPTWSRLLQKCTTDCKQVSLPPHEQHSWLQHCR